MSPVRILDVRALGRPDATEAERARAMACIDEAVAKLRAGGLVALPTETVYGLGARALDEAALARVFAAKGRPPSHPLIAHVLDLERAGSVAVELERARALAAAFWPGPLTLVLPRDPRAPAALSGGLPTVAVRAPAHPVARALIAALGEPIAAPSANRYQHVSPTEAAHVLRSLGDAVELILDGGSASRGIESTVVDLTTSPPRLLRLGPIEAARLRPVLPDLVVAAGVVEAGEARAAPGLDRRHYAPATETRCFAGPRRFGRREGVLLCGGALAATAGTEGARVIVLPREPETYAQGLYAALHALDAAELTCLWIEMVPGDEAWDAVRDRIRRAAG